MSKSQRIRSILKKDQTIPLDEDIFLIIGKNNGTFPYCNALLIADDETVLIDSGIGTKILEPLKDHIDILINSHYHIDHVSGNHLIPELWVSEQENGVTSSFDRYRRFAGIMGTPIESDWLRWFDKHFTFKPSYPTRILKPNEILDFGSTSWRVIHTPGHTPGHCCFYEPERRIMFSSDIDLAGFGPWYGNPNADLDDFAHSIKTVADHDISVIASSHVFPIKAGIVEALNRYLNVLSARDRLILAHLVNEMSLDELEQKNIIYRREQKSYASFAWFEKNMLSKHLLRLVEDGKVKRSNDRFITVGLD